MSNTNTAEAHTPNRQVVMLPIGAISISKGNYRRTIDKQKIRDLALSIEAKGLLQPISVRTVDSDKYEVVTGERRLRAMLHLQQKSVPVFVEDITAEEAEEIRFVENLQREDVHPVEEAEGFGKLLKRGVTPAEIAARVGKSEGFIYRRLRLNELSKFCREEYLAGRLNEGSAYLLTRVPRALQDEACRNITHDETGKPYLEPVMVTDARSYLRETYMLPIADPAPQFPVADAELVPAAGACTVCPKQTANERNLFGDIDGPSLCTDPDCYHGKVDAFWERLKKAAPEKGIKVLDDEKEVSAIFLYGPDRIAPPSGFVDMAETVIDPATGKQTTVRKALGAEAVEIFIVRNEVGKIFEVTKKAQVDGILKKQAAVKRKEAGKPKKTAAEEKADVEQRALRETRAVRKEAVVALRNAGREAIDQGAALELDLLVRAALYRLLRLNYSTLAEIAKEQKKDTDAVLKSIRKLAPAQVKQHLVRVLLAEPFTFEEYSESTEMVVECLSFDIKAAEKQIRTARADAVKAKQEAAPKKTATEKSQTRKEKRTVQTAKAKAKPAPASKPEKPAKTSTSGLPFPKPTPKKKKKSVRRAR